MFPLIARQTLRAFSSSSIKALDLSATKICCLTRETLRTQLPLKSPWQSPSPIQVILSNVKPDKSVHTHYYSGGLPAQMQALRKVEKISQGSVQYVTDGKLTKSIQSGHQGHVHPSEWTAEECNIPNLIRAMLRGLHILPKINPRDFKSYSYLHFPFNKSKFSLLLYGKFAFYGLKHAITATNNISEKDRWLCRCIEESLQYHQVLSDKIKKEQGSPTFDREFRVYWSPNKDGLAKKRATWKELEIPCASLAPEELRTRTLLKIHHVSLDAFKVFGDGKFYPDTPLKIHRYCNKHFPYKYIQREAQVKELHLNKDTKHPVFVRELLADGTTRDVPIRSFFCSPGHNEVFLEDRSLWDEVPISGVSSVWRWEISKKEFFKRMGKILSDEEIRDSFEKMVPLANLSNLHVTSWDSEVLKDQICANIRVSQGGNFNSLVAEKDDLLNMQANLENFLIGKWTLLSVGTCSRKSHTSNVPEYLSLCDDPDHPVGFLHGLSGVGYSFSGASFEAIKGG